METTLMPKLTKAQTDALNLVVRNGRFGIGAFGGIRRQTAEALIRLKLLKKETEWVRGRLREFVVPGGTGCAVCCGG